MDMNIALTGQGKLPVTACIYEAVKSAVPGYFSLPEVKDFDALSKIYRSIEASNDIPDADISGAVTVLLRSKGEDLRIRFGSDDANIIVAVIDTPAMMSGQECGITSAHEAVISALEKDNALLVIVPVKCEGYDEHALRDKTSSAFRDTVELMRTKYRGRACAVIAPVKIHDKKPEGADKVLRYALAFMSGELGGEIRSFADKFCYGIANDEGILCGHELLEPTEYKPEAKTKTQQRTSGSAGKIIAAFIAGCVIAGAGGYFAGSMNNHAADEVRQESSIEIEDIRQELSAEIDRLKASLQSAIQERDKARSESSALKSEKDKAMDMANKYKQQADTLTAENKKLNAEVNRLKDKDKKSIRIPNPFK